MVNHELCYRFERLGLARNGGCAGVGVIGPSWRAASSFIRSLFVEIPSAARDGLTLGSLRGLFLLER